MKLSPKISVPQRLRRHSEAGFTLIELLVVLVVLIALAGIIIPQLPNVITKAHTSSSATNLGEANKAIQTFEQLFLKDPNNLDTLIPGATGTTFVDYAPNTAGTPATTSACGGDLVAVTLNANSLAALNAVGITTVADLQPTSIALAAATPPGTPTFNPYTGTSVTLAADSVLAGPTLAAVQKTLLPNALTTDVFVAFGIGQASELTGHTMSTAPFHFDDDTTNQAVDKYARFLAVYKVDNAAHTITNAQFVGVIGMHSDGVINTGNEVSDYLNTNKLN